MLFASGCGSIAPSVSTDEEPVKHISTKASASLTDFSADHDLVYLRDTTRVIFVVQADKDCGVALYCGEEKVGDMMDDGTEGDEDANDGLYTFVYYYEPKEPGAYTFHAESGKTVSEKLVILVYTTPTGESIRKVDAVDSELQKILDEESDAAKRESAVNEYLESTRTKSEILQYYIEESDGGKTVHVDFANGYTIDRSIS